MDKAGRASHTGSQGGASGMGTIGIDAGDISGLLERQDDIQAIEHAMARVMGEGGVVHVHGPAGIGKSRLLAVAAGMARDQGRRTLTARGGALEVDFPYGMVLQLFEPALRTASPEEREGWLSGAADLARPIFAGADILSTPDAPNPTFSLLHGLLWLATNVAGSTGLVLVLDDAHWADPPSLQFALYLAARLEHLPIVIVLATRAGERGPATDLLDELTLGPLVTTVRPRRLSPAAVATMTRATLPEASEALCRACAQASNGNPFLLKELLLTVVAEDPSAETAEELARMRPEAVSRAVLIRLARLSRGAVPLARAIAILGDHSPLTLAAELAGLEADEAAGLLDELVQGEILASEADSTVGFVHPLIGSTVYAETPATQRQFGHLRAAELLTKAGASHEQVATHLLRSPPTGQAWVVDGLRRSAAQAMAEGAPRIAVRQLRRALEEPPGSEQRGHLLLELGRAEAVAGMVEAADHLGQSAELLSGSEQAAVLGELGRALYWAGEPVKAADAMGRALAVLGSADPSLAQQLRVGLFNVATMDARLRSSDQAAVLVRDVRPGQTTPGDRALLARMAVEAAAAARPRHEALEPDLRALDGGRLLEEETADSLTLYLVTGALNWIDELEPAVAALDAAVDDARRRGSVMAFASASYCRSWIVRYQCRIPDAIADAEQAVDARRHGWKVYLGAAYASLAQAHLERGDLGATAVAVEGEGQDQRWANSATLALLVFARGELSWALGRRSEALERFLEAGTIAAETLGPVSPGVLPWRSQAALVAAQLGDRDRANQLAAEELDLARAVGAARPLGVALRAQGLLADKDHQIDLLREAVQVLAGSPSRLEHVRALVDLGAALRREGHRSDARQPLTEALDLAHSGGALALAERSRQEIVMAGGRPRRPVTSGVDALTAAEQRVAALAASGSTNREIAEGLFVTPKTVEFHLRQVFTKLGITSRRELAEVMPGTAQVRGPVR